MSEPKRWIDEGPPIAVAHLLRAAASERPAEQSLARTLTAVGVGLGAGGAAATASAATVGATAGAKLTGLVATSVLVKWGVAGAALAASVVAGNVLLERAPAGSPRERRPPMAVTSVPTDLRPLDPSSREDVGTLSAPAAAISSTSTVPAERPPAVNGTVKSRRTVEAPRAATAPLEDAEHLAQEVALVDRARAALARGDATGALAALDDYEARFSPRKFAPEALYLRMEALLREGRSGAAQSVAEVLAKSYPKSPHAARARQVLEGTIR